MQEAIPLAIVLSFGLAASPLAQNQLYEIGGADVGAKAGSAVAGVGDVDGDGHADFAVGSPGETGGQGIARVYSGVNASLLYQLTGAADLAFDFGREVAGVGDTNADGLDDVAVLSDRSIYVFAGGDGALRWEVQPSALFLGEVSLAGVPDANGDSYDDVLVGVSELDASIDVDIVTVEAYGPGTATLYSGFDGSVLQTFRGEELGDGFGGAVSYAGDVDGDGRGDVAIACYDEDFPGGSAGYLRVYSTGSGDVLLSIDDAGGPGYVPSDLGDVDGDGRDDLLVGIPLFGTAQILSGAGGGVLQGFTAPDALDDFGVAVSGVDDVDGDGLPDVLVGAAQATKPSMIGPPDPVGPGYVRLFSSATGAALATFDGLEVGAEFGRSLDALGDANADGVPDFVAGAPLRDLHSKGAARVLSTGALSLYSDLQQISLATGGATQFLTLDAGEDFAGGLVVFAGSITGIAPGIPVGGFMLPLIPDAYTLAIAGGAATTIGSPAPFELDGQGRGSQAITIPAVDPAIAPLTLYHAYAVLTPDSGLVVFTSNAAPLHLTP